MKKLWGGCFDKETHHDVELFTTSIHIDARLWEADIICSQAHAEMLGRTGVIPQTEATQLCAGLEDLLRAVRMQEVTFSGAAEDIHSEIERLLGERIGPVAGKLHTGRSRNDQVATATRYYLCEEIKYLMSELKDLQQWLCTGSSAHIKTMMPGLTHLQHAQPVSLAHHLMAYFWMFQRDRERLKDGLKRVNRLPLGSAALAGTAFPIDRRFVAEKLGFEGLCENSLDAVSDRDFVVEFLSAASLISMHLSRLAEELIIWSSPEFGFIRLDDSVTTGSSIMPQKKNPDVAELIRGRTGRCYGALMGVLTTLKALPLAYNRDIQEDKTFLFDGLDTVRACVRLMRLMLETAEFRPEKMKATLAGDFSNATDLADYLVEKGMAFRQAHSVSGQIVSYCLKDGKALENLSVEELCGFADEIGEDILPRLQHEAVMNARSSEGGTGSNPVKEQIQLALKELSQV